MSVIALSNQKEGSPVFTIKSRFGDIELRFCDAVYEVNNFAEENDKYYKFESSLRLRMEADYLKVNDGYRYSRCDIQFYVNGDSRNSLEVIGDSLVFGAVKYQGKFDADEKLIKDDFYDVVGKWVNENEDLVNVKRKELWDDTLKALHSMLNKKKGEVDILQYRISKMEGV